MAKGLGVPGTAVAVAAAGAVLIYSGVQNRRLVEALRELAMGRPVTAGAQKTTAVATAGSALGAAAMTGAVLTVAASYKGTPYLFGGGHGSTPCANSMDCSGYVSCVLAKAGLLRTGPMTTDGLAGWGHSVPFGQRAPGDVLVWVGGPGGGHCGIVIDADHMWHNPCTGCGGVQVGTYGSTRTGRTTLVRRA